MQFDTDTLCHLINGLQKQVNGEEGEHIKDHEVNRVHRDIHGAIATLENMEQELLRLSARYDYVG